MTAQTAFEQFALDHARHVHCLGCGGCLLDPSHLVQGYGTVTWCVGCRDRIKASCQRSGMAPPWEKMGGWEFVGVGAPAEKGQA